MNNIVSSQVSDKLARQWCEDIRAEYFEGSAKEDLDVEKPFLRAAQCGLQQVTQLVLCLLLINTHAQKPNFFYV